MIKAILLMLILGALLGCGLGIASKVFAVEVDERVEHVSSLLPNYNCGGCGYAGCAAMAEALVSGEISDFRCKPCKGDKKEEIITYLKETPGPDGKTIDIKG